MGLIADVTAGNPVSATWGNSIRSASVMQVLASEVASISANEGQLIYVTDEDRFYTYSGAAWVRVGWGSTTSGRTGCTATATTLSVASGASTQTITFGAETFDSDGYITPSSTTVTIPTGLGGLYTIAANIQWDTDPGASTFTSIRILSGSQNYAFRSDTTLFRSAFGTTDYFTGISASLPLAAADQLQLVCTQNSGGAINVNAVLHVYRIGV